MDTDEKYLFDLNGYLILKNVLTPEEVAIANEAIENRSEDEYVSTYYADDSPELVGTHNRLELYGMLEWEPPWCDLFRHLITLSTLVPYLTEMLGKGYRLDHEMAIISMDKGAGGHAFHGSSGPGFDPNQYYIFRDGRMHNGLTVVTFQLTDVPPGAGGLIVIPGSHKSNYSCPEKMRLYQAHQEHIYQPVLGAGDAIIFTEALTHGTIPWTHEHLRRSILLRYTAGNMAFYPAYEIPEWANERQRVVMQHPSCLALNRLTLDD